MAEARLHWATGSHVKLTRRSFVTLLATTSVSVTLAACTGPAAPSATSASVGPSTANTSPAAGSISQPIALRWDSYNFAAPGIGGKAIQTIIDEFQARYPTITIEGHNIPGNGPGTMSAVTTEIAGGNAPDIAQLPLQNVDSAIADLGALPIDQFAPKNEFDDTMNHIVPGARPLGQRN